VKRIQRVRIPLAAYLILLLAVDVAAAEKLRIPTAVGTWYPADPATLHATVKKFIDAAAVESPEYRLAACIVPHAPYGFSGDVAAHAFTLLRPGQFDRVVVLTASHFAEFRGCSIPAVDCFRTPLGDVPLDHDSVRELTWSSLIESRTVSYLGRAARRRTPLHEKEYGVEAILPFLQVQLGAFKLVPLIVGQLTTMDGDPDDAAIESLVDRLRQCIDKRTLVVVGATFTRYGETFGYVPFTDNVPDQLRKLDEETFAPILEKDYRSFRAVVAKSKNATDAALPIELLLRLLPNTAAAALLHYDTSGRKAGRFDESVSYAAFAFFDRADPVLEQEIGGQAMPQEGENDEQF